LPLCSQAFGAIERQVRTPLLPPHTWKVKTLVSGTAVMLGATGILVGVIFLSSVFMQTVLGYTALQTGLAFLPLALGMVAAAHAASHAATKLSARAMATLGLAFTVIGSLLLSRASDNATFALSLLPALVVLGFGVGLVFVSASATSMTGIPPQHAGVASGFLMTGHEIGAALGVAIVSAVATTAGSLTQADGASAAFERGMIAAAALGVVVGVVALVRMPATPQQAAAGMHMHH
jgi:MFS family permease